MKNEGKESIVRHVRKVQGMLKQFPVPALDSKHELAVMVVNEELDAIESECALTRKPRKNSKKEGSDGNV